MELGKYGNSLVVTLTDGEVGRLQEGGVVGARGGLHPDAKVEVYPLSHTDPDARVNNRFEASAQYLRDREKGIEPKVRAELLGNEDLLLHVPDAALNDRRIGGFRVERDTIQTPGIDDTERGARLQIIPPDGVVLNLGGSLERFNTKDRQLPNLDGRWMPESHVRATFSSLYTE